MFDGPVKHSTGIPSPKNGAIAAADARYSMLDGRWCSQTMGQDATELIILKGTGLHSCCRKQCCKNV